MRAIYICDVVVTAKKKNTELKIARDSYPLVLDDSMTIPSDLLDAHITKMVRHRIEYKNIKLYTFSYKINSYKFSSNIYIQLKNNI